MMFIVYVYLYACVCRVNMFLFIFFQTDDADVFIERYIAWPFQIVALKGGGNPKKVNKEANNDCFVGGIFVDLARGVWKSG